jgi:hypothetical protein
MEIGAYFAALLLVCLICHCELAALKPGPKHLTAYFLSMSLGGALGGIFVNLLAPEIFDTFFEMPLAFLASAAIAGWLLILYAFRFGRPATFVAGAFAIATLVAIFNYQVIKPQLVSSNANTLTVFRDRSFFGIVSVQHRSRNEPEYENFAFKSGRVPHGKEFADPARRHDTRLAYWGPDTGCRVTLDYKVAKVPNCHIGVVGLGIGTIAAWAKETDRLRFYEINPQVTHIAKTYFHFLSDCKTKDVEIIHGDARLKLEEELNVNDGKGHQFDVLCLDAFSGDAVPTHLLTTEAFATYKKHLKPDGIIVCNITNSYLDLWPVIKDMGDEHGFKTARIYRPRVPNSLIERTYFAMLTNDEGFLGPVMSGVRERLKGELADSDEPQPVPQVLVRMPANFQKKRDIPLWTDRYHNLFQVLR